MNVAALKSYIREQMDVLNDDLPDSVLDIYLQEAFDRTMAFDNRWPRNEFTWSLSKGIGVDVVTLPTDLNVSSIMSVTAVSNRFAVVPAEHETALRMFSPQYGVTAVGQPIYYSIWNGELWLWPGIVTSQQYDMTVTGYRQPVWTNGASAIPDLDPRLHATLAYFALSLAYAKEEDEVMEAAYLGRWDRDLAQQLKAIKEPNHSRPLVMHGGYPLGGTPGWVINPPIGGP